MATNSSLSRAVIMTSHSRCIAFASIFFGLWLQPSQARAQSVEATLTGAGDESSDDASARMSVGGVFDIRREQPDTFELTLGAPEEADNLEMLVFRGVRRGAMNRMALTIEGEVLRREGSDGGATDLLFAQSSEFALFGWGFEQRLSIQPEGRFSDAYWRSGRGLGSIGGTAKVPPWWGLRQKGRWTFWAVRMEVSYDELVERSAGELKTAEFDLGVDFEFAGVMTRYIDIGMINIRLKEFGVPTGRQGNVTEGLSVTAFELELLTLDLHIGDWMTASTQLGVRFRSPVSPFETVTTDDGVTSRSNGPTHTTPILWFEGGVPASDARPVALNMGGGAFSRISPDGFAADSGVRVAVSATVALAPDTSLELSADAASVTRKLVSELAPDDIDPLGTKFFLARTSAAVTMALTDSISVTASGYGERTDRDDPRRHSTRPDANSWGYGAELSATYRFEP